ncbi:hypothetical protein [Algibacter sp. L4_22]|uniref:acyltransferase n=1 Tax=Algibacter sp. L4_22 TaxID=2942477 RepID=UPI00201B5DE2|nr:hypothetical protein [Algibacter sp. L4_22]MCL5127257.1 hypothetical protein [Algibacter sp. L4_22]
MKKIITLIACLLLPSVVLRSVLRLLGHKIGKRSKIGFSLIRVRSLCLGDDVKIGHLNLILNTKIELSNNARIGYLNILKGPFALQLLTRAAIGNKNYITRGAIGLTYGESILKLGELTKVTTGHHLDVTQSILFGDFSILAGIRSQMWTHGYYHAETGKDRIRIDGKIKIGNNVYIGSGCIFNPGVSVNNAVHVGGGSTISKNLIAPGMYVGQTLRFIDNNLEKITNKLNKVEDPGLIEQVYTKKENGSS